MDPRLHIISFDIPYPANYGGVIDVFYKLKALSETGVQITLHCFQYGNRKPQAELEKYCVQVHYYPRKKISNPFSLVPLIIGSRKDTRLLKNLQTDDAPILFEALHSCYYLNAPGLRKRMKLVRIHNIEHDYYRLLAEAEHHLFKRIYYYFESVLLSAYEKILVHADRLLAISQNDYQQLHGKFGSKVSYLPAFHSNQSVTAKLGKGIYCFYHGKLSIAENNQAALFWVKEVFSKLKVPLIIAGDEASTQLKQAISEHEHIELREGLTPSEIDTYIENAHLNVLVTFQPTGIKLKLLNVLFKGRFVLANSFMVHNTGLESLCEVKTDASSFIEAIPKMMEMDFTEAEIEKRKVILNQTFNVSVQAAALKRLIHPLL